MKELLRSLRNQNNYSQSAVAEYLEISRQMYNKYESGMAEPSLKNIKKLLHWKTIFYRAKTNISVNFCLSLYGNYTLGLSCEDNFWNQTIKII